MDRLISFLCRSSANDTQQNGMFNPLICWDFLCRRIEERRRLVS